MSGFAAPILSALLPIVFGVGLGWFAGRIGAVPKDGTGVLTAFVVKFALPISLFLAAAKAKPEEILDPPYIAALLVGLAGIYAAAYAFARLALRHEPDEAAMQALTCSFPNMAYCGPPVLLAAVGQGALLAVVIGNLVTSLILVPVTLFLLQRHHHSAGKQGEKPVSIGSSVLQALAKPLVFLPLAGVACALAGIHLPGMLIEAADGMGRAAGGAALFTLGLILSGISLRISREISVNVALQNFAQPLLILAVGLLVGLRGDPLKAVFLLGVLPSAAETAMLALANDTYRETAAATVAASTIASLLTISSGIALANYVM